MSLVLWGCAANVGAKCFCLGGKVEISKSFEKQNYGVGCPGGVEVVAHSLRDTLQKFRNSNVALLKIDFRNAFNLIDRDTFIRAVSARFPSLERWTRWCYDSPPLLVYDHRHLFFSSCGVQQGDPLGPLYFCCGLQALVDKISDLEPLYQKWYMDDGGIVGPTELLLKAWDILEREGPKIGLFLNPSKCEWSWLNPSSSCPCPIPGVQLVETEKIQILGVPLGSDSFVSSFVHEHLLARTRNVTAKLIDFEDTQSALYVLRVSYSFVRAVHFMRTTPLHQWRSEAESFDEEVRKCLTGILRSPLPPQSYAQACVSTRLGGLGLRQTVAHAGAAFTASWFESGRTSGENWVRPQGCSEHYLPQTAASTEIDKASLSLLLPQCSPRDAQRLKRLDCPHANAWITALPSTEDSKDTILAPRTFRTAVSRLLGLPLSKPESPCPACKQTMDVYGDHALCCRKTGDMITRHNIVRNWVYKVAEDGLLSPRMEKQGILGPTDPTRRRPADVAIPVWSNGRGLAVDVAVVCPLAPSHLDEEEVGENYGVKLSLRNENGRRASMRNGKIV